ncbi:MAG: hypothetical protein QOJ66_3292 [Ilumatobacteraceae bacterium]
MGVVNDQNWCVHGCRCVVLVVALFGTSACDSDLSRTTGTVTELRAGTICFTPEDRTQTDLLGCFPISDQDASRVHVNDCIELRIPNYLDPKNANTPVKSVRVLNRVCRNS